MYERCLNAPEAFPDQGELLRRRARERALCGRKEYACRRG
jgi:hypothetical protein